MAEFPKMKNLNGIEIRNPISMELHGDLGVKEQVIYPSYQHKIPMPKSFKDYLDKNKDYKMFDRMKKYLSYLEPSLANIWMKPPISLL